MTPHRRASNAVLASALVILCLVGSVGAADYAVRWGHPSPQGQPIFGLAFADDLNGWAVTRGGGVLRSVDGAESWTVIAPAGAFSDDLYDLVVLGDGSLIVGGDSLYRSADGGMTWQALPHPATGTFFDLCLIPGGGVSAASRDGEVVVSFDGGDSWSAAGPGGGDIRQHLWMDSLRGFAVGDGVSHRTLDGGMTWTEAFPASTFGWNTIAAVDDTTIVVYEDFASAVSTDAGQTWTVESVFSAPLYRYRLLVLAPDHWLLTTHLEGAEIWETTDGGLTWTEHYFARDLGFMAIVQLPSGRIVCSDDIGNIRWSDDLGVTLHLGTVDHSRPHGGIGSVDLISHRVDGAIFALSDASSYPDPDLLLRSDDGGLTWMPVPLPPTNGVDGMAWLDADTGLAAGYNSIARTTDGGATWTLLALAPGGRIRSVALPAADRWFCAAANGGTGDAGGDILRSTDGGLTWAPAGGGLPTGTMNSWLVEFDDGGLLGFASGYIGDIKRTYRTLDGGVTWSLVSALETIQDVAFPEPGTVVAVGGFSSYRSTDGGATWTSTALPRTTRGVVFADASRGLAWGSSAAFLATEDGGLTWESVPTPFLSPTPPWDTYNRVDACGVSDEGWIVGGYGNRLVVLNEVSATGVGAGHGGGVTTAVVIDGATPNPFNPITELHFRTSVEGTVRVTVHDLAGRVVRTLSDGPRPAGDHRITWRGVDDAGRPVAAGVYLANVRGGGGAATAKLVLVK